MKNTSEPNSLKWEQTLEQDFLDLRFSYVERNPDNANDTLLTFWAGRESKSRLGSFIGGAIHAALSQQKEEFKKLIPSSKPERGDDRYAVGFNAALKIINKLNENQSDL